MSLYNKIHGGSNNSQGLLTARMFFLEHNPNGYMSTVGFPTYIKSLNESNLGSLELCIEYTKNCIRLNSLPILKMDKAGAPYIWANFQMINSTQGFKILIVERLADFIKDYQQGKITIDFTLEELLQVAESGDTQEAA